MTKLRVALISSRAASGSALRRRMDFLSPFHKPFHISFHRIEHTDLKSGKYILHASFSVLCNAELSVPRLRTDWLSTTHSSSLSTISPLVWAVGTELLVRAKRTKPFFTSRSFFPTESLQYSCPHEPPPCPQGVLHFSERQRPYSAGSFRTSALPTSSKNLQ